MRRAAFVFLLLFGLHVHAHAENWTFVIASENQRIYVDTDSIRKAGQQVRAWSIFNYSTSARVPGTTFDFVSDRSLFFFDCNKKKYGRAVQMLFTEPDAKGEQLTSFSGRMRDIVYEDVVPETIGDNFFSFVCSKI